MCLIRLADSAVKVRQRSDGSEVGVWLQCDSFQAIDQVSVVTTVKRSRSLAIDIETEEVTGWSGVRTLKFAIECLLERIKSTSCCKQ